MDVKTAGRTLELFELFASTREPMTLSEIARSMNLPQSSCFNLVRTLEARGYLYPVGGRKRVYPTRRLLDCAEAICRFDAIVPMVQPVLDELRDDTGETVILGTLQANQTVYLAAAEGRHTIRYISRAGELKPLYSSAIGKALLASKTLTEREQLIKRLEFTRVTDRTIVTSADLRKDIEGAVAQGYAKTVGENVADVAAVACWIVLGGQSYAIAVAGPTSRIEPRIADFAELIQTQINTLREAQQETLTQ